MADTSSRPVCIGEESQTSKLAINFDKTKLVKIGASRDRRLNQEGHFGLDWSHTFTELGIYYDVNNMDNTTYN